MYSPAGMARGEYLTIGAAILAGLLLSIIPSIHAYRTNAVKNLSK